MPYLTLVPNDEDERFQANKDTNQWRFHEKLDLNPGDLILFVHGMSYAGDGDAPDGFPLLSSYDGVNLKIREIRRAEIRSKPDQQTCKVIFNKGKTKLHSENIVDEILEAIRLCTTGKEVEEISLPHFFKFTK